MKNDKYNINRFIEAQEDDYQIALKEIRNGRKESHWIWYIFPQLKDLGYSPTAKFFGISNIEEAKAYFDNEILRNRLLEITSELLNLKTTNISEVMGYPDDLKLKSSMTLFYLSTNNDLFKRVIDKYYDGEMDDKTVAIINKNNKYIL